MRFACESARERAAAEGSHTFSTLRDTAANAPSLEARSPLASTELGENALSAEPGEQERLHRRRSARGLGPDAALASSGEAPAYEVASAGAAPEEPPSCGGQAVPPGWPDFSSSGDELLAPFFTCTSPGEFVALQDRVDMPRLVEALDDWRAVRLGALGPVREDAAGILNRKRASFIVEATEAYGAAHAEVFVRFLADSSFDDDLREILFRLSQDKRLEPTLGLMPQARAELEARSLKLSARPDRDLEAGDLLRGAWSAIDHMAYPDRGNALYAGYSAQRGQLPVPYQEDLDKVERAAVEQHFSPGNVALGSFDHLTFGAPLGFYYLVVGTGQGLRSLSQGKYEQATRELVPAVLLVALYAGGKGVRYLSEGRGAAGVRPHLLTGLEAMELRLRALKETARQLQGVMSLEGLGELARYIQASREAGRFVAVGGADAAWALHEAGGDVARARPLMSRARPGASGSSPSTSEEGAGKAATAEEALRPSATKAPAAERPGTLASLVDEGVGHTREVVKAKLAAAELEATGPRLPRDVSVLEKHRPSLEAPPPEVQGNPRWREYVDYYEERLREVKEGMADKGPLKWEGYERLRGWFARGMAFERGMVKLLRDDAKKPRAERRFLRDFDKPPSTHPLIVAMVARFGGHHPPTPSVRRSHASSATAHPASRTPLCRAALS
jgi:hypothetical protein